MGPMRILVAPAGSRGDVQPCLALAVELQRAGHDVVLATSPSFAAEARAFKLTFAPVGIDVESVLSQAPRRFKRVTPRALLKLLNDLALPELRQQLDALAPLARQAELVVGAGAQMG